NVHHDRRRDRGAEEDDRYQTLGSDSHIRFHYLLPELRLARCGESLGLLSEDLEGEPCEAVEATEAGPPQFDRASLGRGRALHLERHALLNRGLAGDAHPVQLDLGCLVKLGAPQSVLLKEDGDFLEVPDPLLGDPSEDGGPPVYLLYQVRNRLSRILGEPGEFHAHLQLRSYVLVRRGIPLEHLDVVAYPGDLATSNIRTTGPACCPTPSLCLATRAVQFRRAMLSS